MVGQTVEIGYDLMDEVFRVRLFGFRSDLRQHDRQCVSVNVFRWGPYYKSCLFVGARAHRAPRGSQLAFVVSLLFCLFGVDHAYIYI